MAVKWSSPRRLGDASHNMQTRFDDAVIVATPESRTLMARGIVSGLSLAV